MYLKYKESNNLQYVALGNKGNRKAFHNIFIENGVQKLPRAPTEWMAHVAGRGIQDSSYSTFCLKAPVASAI
jgi:hypothetical protein